MLLEIPPQFVQRLPRERCRELVPARGLIVLRGTRKVRGDNQAEPPLAQRAQQGTVTLDEHPKVEGVPGCDEIQKDWGTSVCVTADGKAIREEADRLALASTKDEAGHLGLRDTRAR